MTVKAISLWEPWASLMRCGAKTIETRSWHTSHRGPLLICAAHYWSRELDELLAEDVFQNALSEPGGNAVTRTDMLFGKAACLVHLFDCVPTTTTITTALDPAAIREYRFGNFSPGRFAWLTCNLQTLEPFPVRGRQGLFNVEIPDRLLPIAQASR